MKTRTDSRKRKMFIILSIAIVVVAAFLRLAHNKEKADSLVYTYDKERPVAVAVDTVRMEPLGEELSYAGLFEPDQETRLSAELQGKITAVLVDVGSRVRQGQPLVLLDNALLRLQLQGVEVQVDGLQSDVDRFTVLAKADAIQGVQLEKAELALRAAMVQKATLQEQIAKTTIRAPFAGIVTARLSEEGAFAAPGVPLIQLTDIAQLRFTLYVPEADIVRFKEEQTFRITADALPGVPLSGTVVLTGIKADQANSYPVQLRVTNTPDLSIRAGMFGRVYLQDDQQQEGVLLASSAIMMDSGSPHVYMVKHGRAARHGVSTGRQLGHKVVVTGGLNPGDVVVTSGFIDLHDSANVKIK